MAEANKNALNKLSDYADALADAKFDNRLNPEGEATLKAIEDGALTSPLVANLLQGATFNLSDEVLGWIRANLTPGLSVDDAIDIERAGLAQSSQESPIASTVQQLTGAALPVAMTRGKAGLPTVAGEILPNAAFGGAFGFGASEGTPRERLADTAAGTGMGAVIGPTVQLASKPISAMAGGMSRLVRGPKSLANQQARELIKEALENDATNVEEAILYVLNKNTTGKPYTLADLGPNSQALLDAVNVLPGAGKKQAQQFLAKRDKGILSRLTSDLQEAFGSRAGFFAEYKALQNARFTTGNKLYERAYRKNVRITKDLQNLFQRPSMQAALQRAMKIAAEEGVNLPKISFAPNGRILGPKGTTVRALPTRLLHYVKRGLDDEVFVSKSPTSGAGKDLVNAAKGTRTAFLEILDNENPSYKIARNYWSGKSAVMDAMQTGRDFLRADVDELADSLASLSGSELEAFRLGAMQGILNEMEKGAERTAVQRLIRSPQREKLLRLTFPSTDAGKKAADKFMNNLADEIIMRETSKGVLSGSQTAARTEVVRTIREAAEVNPVTGLTDLVSRAISRDFKTIATEQETQVASEIARMLVENNPAKLAAIQKDLTKQGIKEVVKKYAPSLAPRLARMIVNPRTISAQVGTQTSNLGVGQQISNLVP